MDVRVPATLEVGLTVKTIARGGHGILIVIEQCVQLIL